MSLRQIIYISSASKSFKESDLKDILETSVRNNEKFDVSGLLLYNDLTFLQVLEGGSVALDTLLQKIRNDNRNTNLIILMDREVNERDFPFWFMSLKKVSNTELLEHSNVMSLEYFFDIHEGDSKAFGLLKCFYKLI